MLFETLVMSIHVHTFKVRVGAYYKNMRPCVEAEAGGGIVSKMGGDLFGPKVVSAVVTHVLSIVKFGCLGDVRIWGGGVVPKNIGEVVVQ